MYNPIYMKVLGFMPLHYGREYLYATLAAVGPFIDQFLIVYTSTPSYGHVGDLPNPETQEELYQIAKDTLGNKLIWNTIKHNSVEGNHRNQVLKYLGGFDMIFSIDGDEVHDPGLVPEMLKDAWSNPCKTVGLGGDRWYHFWRSFNECHRDGFYPIRFQKKGGIPFNAADGIIHSGKVYHMGYAQSEEVTRYKMSCHGHKGEISPTYLEDKWINYKKGETTCMHPASNGIWVETEPFDRFTMPDILKNHANFNKERI